MSPASSSADPLPAEGESARDLAAASAGWKGLARGEVALVALGLLVLAVLRALTVITHKWNTDEPQHLHVVWAWTAGQLQYRDLFDNHTPLFHILSIPLLRWFGERADIIPLMRLAMIPLFAMALWCVYRLGAALYDRRVGWFAALLAGFFPPFFFRMGEYRTDVLWTAVWLASLLVAVSGELTVSRLFWAALLLGAAFMTSMKTSLLLLCVALAAGISWLLAGRPISRAWPRYALAFVAGLCVAPGLIAGYFAARGALRPFYYCVIAHNTMPGRNLAWDATRHLFSHSSLWLIPLAILVRLMLPAMRRDPGRGYRRLFLLLVAGLFYPLLRGIWPVVTTQDYLPWMPLLPIFVVAGADWLWEQARTCCRVPWMLLPALLVIIEGGMLLTSEPFFVRGTEGHLSLAKGDDGHIERLAELLKLVDPGEYVFDLKGETIFRPRSCYLVMESLTLEQLRRGLLTNDINQRLIDTRTTVARLSDRMPLETREFVQRNYLRLRRWWVLGKPLPAVPNVALPFDVLIPESYEIVGSKAPISGMLDGRPIDGPRWLDAGRHELTLFQPAGEISLVWARAIERGFSPYARPEPSSDVR